MIHVFDFNGGRFFATALPAALCCSLGCTMLQLAAGSAPAATPVQPELQHSAAGSALPAALCCSSGCTVLQLAAGSAPTATPVQPELQHSAAGSALPAALCCSSGCTVLQLAAGSALPSHSLFNLEVFLWTKSQNRLIPTHCSGF